ncbi:MAG: hypothetical protein IIU51_05315, partial [Bacteroidaceae bacterium]|nr:hypothetical protein [Bacteroidaceae bacterium]
AVAPQPREGWMAYTYRVASSILYPQEDGEHTQAQRDGAVCFLHFLRTLFDYCTYPQWKNLFTSLSISSWLPLMSARRDLSP